MAKQTGTTAEPAATSEPAPSMTAAPPPDARALEEAATVEALLFSSDSPLPAARIARVGELGGTRRVRDAVALLNRRYERDGSAFRIEEIAGGYQMLTRPEYHDVVARLHQARSENRLSQAAMETLAIVAYRQPILRADVEAIRGVACGEVLRGLLDKQLVKIVGRAEVLGRPMLYGTTRRFLEVFALRSLDDLPRVEELRSGAPQSPTARSHAAEPSSVEQAEAGQSPAEPDSGAKGQAPSEPAAAAEEFPPTPETAELVPEDSGEAVEIADEEGDIEEDGRAAADAQEPAEEGAYVPAEAPHEKDGEENDVSQP